MTAGVPALVAGESAVARYEQLRQDVIEGASGGGRFGTIVLLREGLATWLAQAPAHTTVVRPPAAPLGLYATSPAGTEMHQSLVRLLATMALASRVEPCP